MVEIATRIALGDTLKNLGYGSGLLPARGYVAAKAPVFSFSKIGLAEIALGPEMKSTGESILFIDSLKDDAFYEIYTRRKMYLSK